MSAQLEEYRKQQTLIKARIQLYKEQLNEEASPSRRQELRQKLTAYRTVSRELQEQIDHLDPPPVRKVRRGATQVFSADAFEQSFFATSKEAFSNLKGETWEQLIANQTVDISIQSDMLQQWLRAAATRLTARQRAYMSAYYNDGASMSKIAECYGTTPSTVSRVLSNGRRRMQQWLDAKRLICSCADNQDGFDWVRYIRDAPVFTDRQRQLLLLVLSKCPVSQTEMADKLELKRSSICKTLSKAGNMLKRLEVTGGKPISRPVIRSWTTADKYTLAIQTGMPLYFYYRYCFRGERIGALTRYGYEVKRRFDAGETIEEIAAEMGISVRTARSAKHRLAKQNIAEQANLPAYSIGANLDPETYLKLQRLVTERC